eukprot:9914221-Alexandrium_andersonii.AAC.1
MREGWVNAQSLLHSLQVPQSHGRSIFNNHVDAEVRSPAGKDRGDGRHGVEQAGPGAAQARPAAVVAGR